MSKKKLDILEDNNKSFNRINFYKLSSVNINSENLKFERCIFNQVKINPQQGLSGKEGVDLSNRNLKNNTFIDCDLTGVNLSYSNLENSSFVRCNLAGVNFNYTNLANSSITECTIGSNLNNAKLNNVKFIACINTNESNKTKFSILSRFLGDSADNYPSVQVTNVLSQDIIKAPDNKETYEERSIKQVKSDERQISRIQNTLQKLLQHKGNEKDRAQKANRKDNRERGRN